MKGVRNFEGSPNDCMTPSSSDDIYCLLFRHDVISDVRMLPIKKHKKIKEPNLPKPNLT